MKEQIDIRNTSIEYNASHLIQLPMDIFFANYFHELYPEETDSRMEMAMLLTYQEPYYTLTRDIMYKQELIDNKNPCFLILPEHPYLAYERALPDWHMTQGAIVEHILNVNPTLQQIKETNEIILGKILDKFEIKRSSNS